MTASVATRGHGDEACEESNESKATELIHMRDEIHDIFIAVCT